jgi:Na+/H+ antiporter
MHSIEVVLAMLLAVVVSGYLVRTLPVSIPLPLVQIGLGAVIAGGFKRGVALDPGLFFLLFLPPLLFLDGWRIPKTGLFRDRTVILELALGLVLFTVVCAGFLIHWLIPGMPLPVAFALAAIVSPTDPVAVSSIAARTPIPKRMMHILEGESLLNDASGLVAFRFAVAAAMTGGFSLGAASLTFLWLAIGGLAIGTGVTFGISLAQRWLSRRFGEESGSPILLNLLTPFGAYLAAEHLGASGILAAVAAGVTMSYVELSGRALATTRVQRAAVWDTAQFALNGIVFVLLGEQLPWILVDAISFVRGMGSHPAWLAVYALGLSLGLAVLRFVWVWTSLRWTLFRANLRGERMRAPQWRMVLAISMAGVRGALTLAGVLTLPLALPDGSPFPARELSVFLAAAVILFSLLTAAFGLPRVLRNLEVSVADDAESDEEHARRRAAHAAVEAVERARQRLELDATDAELYTSAATRVIASYQRLIDPEPATGVDAARLRRADRAERELRLAALAAERDTIFELARRNQLSDEVSRKLVREIDLLDERFRLALHGHEGAST